MPSTSSPAEGLCREALRSALDALLRISALASSPAPPAEVLSTMLPAVAEGLGYDRVALYLLRPGTTLLERVATVGTDPGAAGANLDLRRDHCLETAVVRSGSALRLRLRDGAAELTALDAERNLAFGRTECAFVPICSRDAVIGLVEADRSPRGVEVVDADVELLAAFASQVGAVVENQRLQAANQAKIGQLLALQRIAREMTSTLEIGTLLTMVVEEAARLSGAEAGVLYLLEPGGEKLRLSASTGLGPPPGREELPIGYGIPGWVARTGRALRVSDRVARVDLASAATRRSQLAVPLLSEGRVSGVLAVEGTGEEVFSADHEEVLGIFAAQAAKSIEAARFLDLIRQERDLRERILKGSPNGVIALDVARRIVWVNPAGREILSLPPDPPGEPVERYLPLAGFSDALAEVLAGASDLERVEGAIGERHVLASVSPLGEGGGGATVILQDLTEKRKVDEQVQRMARLASIGQLAAGIAHEIRNPLTGIGISLEILREEEGLTGPGRSLIDDIGSEIDRLETLIRGLLAFARPKPAERRPMRISGALEWQGTFREQCRKKGVDFRVEVLENPKLLGDPEKLKQLFLNLAINALEATEPGGEVRISVNTLVRRGERWARVLVADTGRGMDEETMAQIFHPFFTTKREGTGLGLATAHSIAEQHGGRIEVHSEPGRGSRFVAELPILEAAGGADV